MWPPGWRWPRVATPMMTLIIQRAEHRDTQAIHAKLDELLRAEGFTDIRYVETKGSGAVTRGEIDFITGFAIQQLKAIDASEPMTVLAGVHVGCFELFAQENTRGIAGLKGKSVGLRLSPPDLLTLMGGHVGLDPAKDIHWVTDPSVNPLALFVEGKIDAFLGFPPEPQELHARKAPVR